MSGRDRDSRGIRPNGGSVWRNIAPQEETSSRLHRAWRLCLGLATSICQDAVCSKESRPEFPRIDAHAHVFKSAPQFFGMLKRLNICILDICA